MRESSTITTFQSTWETMGSLLAVLAPLAAVPITIITFYLRSLREHQRSHSADLTRRIEAVESAHRELQRAIDTVQRDYTTKEEWLREHLHARRAIEYLTRSTTRIETMLETATAIWWRKARRHEGKGSRDRGTKGSRMHRRKSAIGNRKSPRSVPRP